MTLNYKDVVSYGSETLANGILSALTTTNMLSRRRRVQDNSNTNYVDFSKLLDPTYEYDEATDQDAAFYSMVSSLVQQGKELINEDIDSNNGEPLVINSLMESFLGGSDTSNSTSASSPLFFRWQLTEEGFTLELPGINPVTLKALNIGGLDTFNMVNILNPTPGDPQTIQNEAGLDTLVLELEMEEHFTRLEEQGMNAMSLLILQSVYSNVTREQT